MKSSLHYFETNKWYKNQEDIVITKDIDICTAKFELKESEKTQGHYLADQASTVIDIVVIVK